MGTRAASECFHSFFEFSLKEEERRKGQQLVNITYQNVNSLCSTQGNLWKVVLLVVSRFRTTCMVDSMCVVLWTGSSLKPRRVSMTLYFSLLATFFLLSDTKKAYKLRPHPKYVTLNCSIFLVGILIIFYAATQTYIFHSTVLHQHLL